MKADGNVPFAVHKTTRERDISEEKRCDLVCMSIVSSV